MAQVDQKLKEWQRIFKGLHVFKPSTSKARKRKQNKRKGIKWKLARMEKTRVLQKVLPRVNYDSVGITFGMEDIFVAALVSLSRREAKVLHETVKLDNRFSEAAKAYISDS